MVPGSITSGCRSFKPFLFSADLPPLDSGTTATPRFERACPFTFYSVGANGTDDDGQAAFKELRDGRTWQRDEGDWVWTYPEAANR